MSADLSRGNLTIIDVSDVTDALARISGINNLILSVSLFISISLLVQMIAGIIIYVLWPDTVMFVTLIAEQFCFAAPGVFAGWIAWRNVDVLHTIIDPLSRVSLLVFGISYLILGFISIVYYESYYWIIMMILAVIGLLAARSIKTLRHQKLPVLNLHLIDLIKSSVSKERRMPIPHTGTPRGWGFLIAGIGLVVLFEAIGIGAGFWVAVRTGRPEGAADFSSLSTLISFVSVYFLLRARVEFQPKAEVMLQGDRRRPVLFLRSFSDDERVSYKQAFMERKLFDVSLEDRLACHFLETGPFIAVSSTGRAVPVVGAARTSLNDAEWQSKVVEWMDSASLIVVVAGTTHWVEWELGQIVQRGYTNKLILLFPTTNMSDRLQVVKNAFINSLWGAQLDLREPSDMRGLIFGENGHVILVKAHSERPPDLRVPAYIGMRADQNGYELASLIGQYLLTNPIPSWTPERDRVSVPRTMMGR